jgi:hypothetical protein
MHFKIFEERDGICKAPDIEPSLLQMEGHEMEEIGLVIDGCNETAHTSHPFPILQVVYPNW